MSAQSDAVSGNLSTKPTGVGIPPVLMSLGLGIGFILVMSLLLHPCTQVSETLATGDTVNVLQCSGTTNKLLGDVFLDRSVSANNPGWPYPLTIQNLMWLFFFIGMGELIVRLREGSRETAFLSMGLLPQDDRIMLRTGDLGPIYAKVSHQAIEQNGFLPRMIARCIRQFQGSRSTDQANTLLNSSLELYHHEIDLRYNMLRYLVWLIPTLGFIGTVIGIALALAAAGDVPDIQNPALVRPWVVGLTSKLGVAFYTTLLALVLSAIMVFLLHVAQAREELALNKAGQYCLDNLINRLYEK